MHYYITETNRVFRYILRFVVMLYLMSHFYIKRYYRNIIAGDEITPLRCRDASLSD